MLIPVRAARAARMFDDVLGTKLSVALGLEAVPVAARPGAGQSLAGPRHLLRRLLAAQQLSHHRPLFLQLVGCRVHFGAAEVVDEQTLDDLQPLALAANRERTN